MELGCGEGGTSRRAVWSPGALRVFLCSSGQRAERQLGQRRARGEESTLRKALHYLKGKRSREYGQLTFSVFSMSVSFLYGFNTHEVCSHNINQLQDKKLNA